MVSSTHLITSIFSLILGFNNPVLLVAQDAHSSALKTQNQAIQQIEPGNDGTIDDDDDEETGEP